MSYTPALNEFTVTNTVSAGFPTVLAAYVRSNVTNLIPNVSAHLALVLLDINGNPIDGTTFNQTISLIGLTALNNIIHSGIQNVASSQGVTIS